MELGELYSGIDLQPEIIQKLNHISSNIDIMKIDSYLYQLMNIEIAPEAYRYLQSYLQDDSGNLKMLYCQLECARRLFAQYQEKHIPEKIFYDTMKCYSRFIEECRIKNGQYFFDRGWWTYRQISMNLFRIGTLEYQFQEYEGENTIGIHIPSDADLSKQAVDRSLRQAALFFQTFYSEYEYNKYTCNSWLLSPVHKSLLPETSNIINFQQRFQVVREDREDKEYFEWLFQTPAHTAYETLPENTRLQKNAKKLLLDGGAIGSAYGFMSLF